jgi:hypothetical protein
MGDWEPPEKSSEHETERFDAFKTCPDCPGRPLDPDF